MSRTIIVSNRLPVKIQRKENEIIFKPSEGGLATGLGSIYKKNNNLWVGWPGTYLNSDKEKSSVRKALAKSSMLPVFLSKQEIKDYYEGFSNETLWPAFHYFPQYAVYEQKFWEAYVRVNQKFCTEVSKVLEDGDEVWVHDYQLLLLPSMLREKFPNITIGFFLHIPFPSYEIFRLLPWREKLLEGMLGADLLGFHTFDYARHFLSSLDRALGVSNVGGQVLYKGRTILADAFPMSIDYDLYERTARSPKAIAVEEKLRKNIGDKKIIISIDRLDYSKGIPERLNAFDQFLQEYPQFREKVSLIQVLVPSRDKVEMYRQLKEEINRKVGEINSSYGSITWTPVYYFYRSFPLEQLSAFYRMADIALVTPLRDGMNLVCKEYIASRHDKKGVLILSELAGAAMELSDAILINPNDSNQLVKAIHTALTMPVEKQQLSIETMQSTVRKFNIHHWVDLFMERLAYTKSNQKQLITQSLDIKKLEKIKEPYINAAERIFLLDYDGTLVSFKDEPKEAKPDRTLVHLLKQLSSDPLNRVVVVSGRDRHTLEGWMGHLDIDFVAEHGIWVKLRGEKWKSTETIDDKWKPQILPILEQFANRTPGAFIEEKAFSIAWHYRKVERGLGAHRSRELINHLRYITSSLNVMVLEGDKVIEVKNSVINKGRAVTRWTRNVKDTFIMAIGDDLTDEDMFQAMPPEAITIKVRGHVSSAKYTLASHNDVRSLLKKLIKWSAPGNQKRSVLMRA